MRRTGIAGGLFIVLIADIASAAAATPLPSAQLAAIEIASELAQPAKRTLGAIDAQQERELQAPPPTPPDPNAPPAPPPVDPNAPPAPPADPAAPPDPPPAPPPQPPPDGPADPAAPPAAATDPSAPAPDAPTPPVAPPPEPPPAAPPPAAEPAPAPPPITTAPATSPYATPGPDVGAAPPESAEPPPPERSLGIQIGAGLNTRLGGDTSGIPEDEPVGLAYGAGVWFAPDRLWSIGLSYQRLGLGGGETSGGETSISVQRDLDTLWLGGRAYPLRSDTIGLYVGLALGASWQSVSASGSRAGSPGGVNPPSPFACSASDGPGLALGGGVGVDVDMNRNVAFLAQVEGTGHQLTSDPIEGCAPGSGSVTGVGASIGFMYRFDLDTTPRRSTAQR